MQNASLCILERHFVLIYACLCSRWFFKLYGNITVLQEGQFDYYTVKLEKFVKWRYNYISLFLSVNHGALEEAYNSVNAGKLWEQNMEWCRGRDARPEEQQQWRMKEVEKDEKEEKTINSHCMGRGEDQNRVLHVSLCQVYCFPIYLKGCLVTISLFSVEFSHRACDSLPHSPYQKI